MGFKNGIGKSIKSINPSVFNVKLPNKPLPELNDDLINIKPKTITNNFNNSKIGVIIQDSDLDKSPITNNVKAEPNNNPEQKSSVKKILDSLTNNKLFILIITLVVEEITIGKIWKFILNMF
ncbi:hypothetical protein [Algibacter sp. L1A34]|uniref:hypothetical protein n=1 Tax=Algibacter sp. L1A34 TaxID=2686365 RepID=UPI00131DA97A|nr:hypothetical protein [Algibacter sp. L1A34]